MSPFANEVVLITGGSSGLGRGLARRLAVEGAAVGAIGRNRDALDSLGRELAGGRYAAAVADVADRDALAAAVRELEEKLGPTDRLILSAGIARAMPARQFSAAGFAEVVRTNLLGAANAVAAVVPGMIERKRGHLVAVSSLAALRGLPLMSAYCASKAGVNSLFDSLAVELRTFNIAVTTICPGWVRTPMMAHVPYAPRYVLELDDAVERILSAIRSRRRFAAFPRPAVFRMRLLRWLPAAIADRLVARKIRLLKLTQKPGEPAA